MINYQEKAKSKDLQKVAVAARPPYIYFTCVLSIPTPH